MSQAGTTPLLSVENLTIVQAWGSRALVRGIDFTLDAGRTLCLVGESGSGKSITSLSIMGLLPRNLVVPPGSAIRLDGKNVLEFQPARLRALRARRIAMIFQEPMTALNPVVPVGRQLDEVLRIHTRLGAKERRRRVLAMMEEVRLPDVERIWRSYPHTLSGGQRQRIMIAMALILEPRLLLADEPTTALDVTTQRQILALIKDLSARHGTAVLFVTHDMGVVADIADEVAVMRKGEIVEHGPVRQVLRAPHASYTRDLLEAVPSLVPREPRPDDAAPIVLRAERLSKRYERRPFFGRPSIVQAASAVDLALRPGRTLGIVGESGSGKSTVARCILRLIDPTEGSISLAGQEIARLDRAALKPHRRRIQIVFQDPYRSLNPRLKVGAIMTEGPLNFGVERSVAVRKAAELLEMVGLPADSVRRFPHEFSGGQRQRIAIARALMLEPDVLVADEAVSALDVSVQAQVLGLLSDLQERLRLALLFITHDLRVAAQICDEVMVMHEGRVVEHGAAADVLANPRADYTRELVMAAPGRGWDFGTFGPVSPALA